MVNYVIEKDEVEWVIEQCEMILKLEKEVVLLWVVYLKLWEWVQINKWVVEVFEQVVIFEDLVVEKKYIIFLYDWFLECNIVCNIIGFYIFNDIGIYFLLFGKLVIVFEIWEGLY